MANSTQKTRTAGRVFTDVNDEIKRNKDVPIVTVPIGSTPYEVQCEPGEVRLDGVPCFGVCDTGYGRIKLSGDVTASKVWQTLWHELTHAWCAEFDVNNAMSNELEEAMCNIIALGMAFITPDKFRELYELAMAGTSVTGGEA